MDTNCVDKGLTWGRKIPMVGSTFESGLNVVSFVSYGRFNERTIVLIFTYLLYFIKWELYRVILKPY